MKSCQAHGRTTPATSPRRKTRRPLFLMSQASGAPEGDSALAGERASASDGACSLHELRLLIFTSPLEACPATKSHFDSTPAVSGFLGPVFSLRFPTQLTLPGSCFCFLLAIGSFLAFFLQHIPNFSFLFLLFLFPAFLLSGIAVANRTGGMVFQVQALAQVFQIHCTYLLRVMQRPKRVQTSANEGNILLTLSAFESG